VKVLDEPLDELTAQKVTFLARRTEPGFNWPRELGLDPSTGQPVAVISLFVAGQTWESAMDARTTHTWSPRRKVELALRVTAAVTAAHAARSPTLFLGDVLKAGNLLVHGTAMTFIDTPSVGVSGLRTPDGRCVAVHTRVRTPGYTAPELLDAPSVAPSHASDVFALATLLCELFYGRPPTEPRASAASIGWDPDESVRQRVFFPWANHPTLEAPTYDPIELPAPVQALLRSALTGPSHERPTARQIEDALTHWQHDLTPWWGRRPAWRQWTWKTTERLGTVLFLVAAAALLARALGAGGAAPPPPAVPELPRKPVGPPLFPELFP
jgi:hypothetical protein